MYLLPVCKYILEKRQKKRESARDLDHLKYIVVHNFPLAHLADYCYLGYIIYFHPFANIMHMHAFMVGWSVSAAPLDARKQAHSCSIRTLLIS